MASKVLSVLLGVLVLTGCAGMGSQTVKPEKLVLDWKDFYPSDFVPGCNQIHNSENMLKTVINTVNRTCYRSRFGNTDLYSLIVDVTDFNQDYQSVFTNINKNEFLSEEINKLIRANCVSDVKRFHNNAYSCQLANKQNILLVKNYVVGKGQFVEARLALIPDNHQMSDLRSEYRTSMKIISDHNLLQFLTN